VFADGKAILPRRPGQSDWDDGDARLAIID